MLCIYSYVILISFCILFSCFALHFIWSYPIDDDRNFECVNDFRLFELNIAPVIYFFSSRNNSNKQTSNQRQTKQSCTRFFSQNASKAHKNVYKNEIMADSECRTEKKVKSPNKRSNTWKEIYTRNVHNDIRALRTLQKKKHFPFQHYFINIISINVKTVKSKVHQNVSNT